MEGGSLRGFLGQSDPGRTASMCKGPEAAVCLLLGGQEPSVAAA